jgi:PhnB protein
MTEDHMATINTYLAFDGNCREAMTFYRDCLGGELNLMTVSESQIAAQMPKENQSSIMHSTLTKGGLTLMACDAMGSYTLRPGNNVSLMLYCETEEEIRTFFAKIAAGGTINTELKVEFWGSIYGDVTDKFGIRWMFNYDQPKA